MRSAEEIALLMASGASGSLVQLGQTRFRHRLVTHWAIAEGSRVLEIGCGQGDTTAVLADAVGIEGRVVAVDIGEPSYGAPITVGDSARHLSDGPLGGRIEFHFSFNALDPKNAFPDDSFDAIVLAHCSWYFDSTDKLKAMLEHIRPWSRRLCISEWDLEPKSFDQVGHLLAVLIQGQIEAYKTDSKANIRSPYSKESVLSLLGEAGWVVESLTSIDSSELSDSAWEIDACLSSSARESNHWGLPKKLQDLVGCQLDILSGFSRAHPSRSLPSFSIVARRNDSRPT
jgi:SAM-dependent methyltransferase